MLTEKGRSFNWNKECQIAFNTLKSALISAPILAFPQGNCEFILDCDASNVALDAVLSQIQDGEERVIAYYSKCFSRTERNYCTTRRELLAVVSSIKYFHHYLYGRHFTVRSDHGSLRWLMNFKNIGQIARWLETLASYDFMIVHRSGRLHSNADSLSRRPCLQDNCKYCSNVDSRYATEDPGVATRASWVVGESTNMGECIEKDGTQLVIDGLAPPDKWTIKGKSSGSVDVHLQKLTSEDSIPKCFKINSPRAPDKFLHAPKRNFFKPYSNKSLCPKTQKNILCFIIKSFVAMETLYELCKTDIWSRISVAQNIVFLANKSCINFIDSTMFV